jgi:hypothetical protein
MNDRLSLVFGALADPIRRAILTRLIEGDATVAELAAPFAVSGSSTPPATWCSAPSPTPSWSYGGWGRAS